MQEFFVDTADAKGISLGIHPRVVWLWQLVDIGWCLGTELSWVYRVSLPGQTLNLVVITGWGNAGAGLRPRAHHASILLRSTFLDDLRLTRVKLRLKVLKTCLVCRRFQARSSCFSPLSNNWGVNVPPIYRIDYAAAARQNFVALIQILVDVLIRGWLTL